MLALKRLERSAVKVARSVLMGRDHSNVVSLPTFIGLMAMRNLTKQSQIPPAIHLQALPRHIRIVHQIHQRLRNVFWRTMAF